ncbi:M14 family metallopeptidase [Aggregatilineales bacterium SYSU G02658]
MTYHIDFSEYFDYDALTAHLQGLAAAYPQLAALESIGQSWRGRDIWAMTITDAATGPHHDKPALYIDAHIHAEEVATSHTALYTIWYLLSHYESDPLVTWLLQNTTFYILPRTNPDGAEISLKTAHHWCGNGRYLPGEEQTRGLCQQDVNGDGFIVQMRVPDPAGEWKVSDEDPRLMVLREPGEVGGVYYRLYREGVVKGDWDGVTIEIERPRDGNLNRNFPAGWRPEFREYGAGESPLSEPESRAVMRFLLDHPNIAGMQCYHTHGGVILRPSLVAPDSVIPPHDLALYKALGAVGTTLTGYPVISVFEEFTADPSNPRVGSLMQWSYDEMGIVTFSTELWNPELAAGIADPAKYQVRARSTADEIALLKYNDEHLGGRGFIDWQPFDHPQLGPVEIGGWTHMYTFRNPPPASWAASEQARGFLHQTIHTNCLFTLRHAACAPLVRVESAQAERLTADLVKVSAVVANHGYLPTYTSQRALEHDTAGTVTVSIHVAEGDLLIGQPTQDLGHLAGRDERRAPWSPWMRAWNTTRKPVEWLVRTTDSALTLTARAPRAGAHQVTVDVKG